MLDMWRMALVMQEVEILEPDQAPHGAEWVRCHGKKARKQRAAPALRRAEHMGSIAKPGGTHVGVLERNRAVADGCHWSVGARDATHVLQELTGVGVSTAVDLDASHGARRGK